MNKLEDIQPIALELWRALKPYCDKAKVAGSIRRQKPIVKDIELVLLPKDVSSRNKIGLYILEHGKVLKGKFTGRHVKAMYRGFPVDIFMPQRHDYYRQLAIRTGSSDFSKQMAYLWKIRGYVGTKDGLVLLTGEDKKPVSWDSEQHFFKWLGLDYIKPSERH